MDALFKFVSAYNLEDLEEIRMRILGSIADKGFDHYLGFIRKMNRLIDRALRDDAILGDDDFWSENLFPGVWWKTEIPNLNKLPGFWRQVKRATSFGEGSAVGSLLKMTIDYTSLFDVKKIVGKADWMTKQQTVMFLAAIPAYLRNSDTMFPVFANMDYTYRKAKEGDKGTKKEGGPAPFADKPYLVRKALPLFTAAMRGSGPLMLKLLQQLNVKPASTPQERRHEKHCGKREGKFAAGKGGISLTEITEGIFADLPLLTPREVQFIKSRIADPEFRVFLDRLNASDGPKGSASLAQVYFVPDGHEGTAVVKFLKPMYVFYFLCECNLLLTEVWRRIAALADTPEIAMDVRRLLLALVREFGHEFDFSREAKFTVQGFEVYNRPKINVRSIQLLGANLEPFPALVTTKAPGAGLDKWIERKDVPVGRVETLYRAISNLLTLWFKNAFWGTGLIHADLHPGNIFVSEDMTFVTLIDYGSCVVLRERQQCLLVDAMVISAQFTEMIEYIPAIAPDNCTTPVKQDLDRVEGPLSFYRGRLTPQQWVGLRERLGADTGRVDREHAQNIQTGIKFVKKIWQACRVAERPLSEVTQVAEDILDYTRYLSFGVLFVAIANKAINGLGECISNEILMFGRGIAYIGTMVGNVQEVCSDLERCPFFELSPIVKGLLFRHPGQLLRLARTGSVCRRGVAEAPRPPLSPTPAPTPAPTTAPTLSSSTPTSPYSKLKEVATEKALEGLEHVKGQVKARVTEEQKKLQKEIESVSDQINALSSQLDELFPGLKSRGKELLLRG